MARLQTGSIAGLHLELISDHLDQHKRMTELSASEEEAIRQALADALSRIVAVVAVERPGHSNGPRT